MSFFVIKNMVMFTWMAILTRNSGSHYTLSDNRQSHKVQTPVTTNPPSDKIQSTLETDNHSIISEISSTGNKNLALTPYSLSKIVIVGQPQHPRTQQERQDLALIGLQIVRNSCYVNPILQYLYNIPKMTHFITIIIKKTLTGIIFLDIKAN